MNMPASAARLRVIGMLGGMSWESSAEYYRLANELVRERLGGLHSARLVLASVDFAEIEQLQVTGRWEQAGELLAQAARAVEAAGAELLLLCSNTMHKVAEQVQDAVSIPLLHLADATAAASNANTKAANATAAAADANTKAANATSSIPAAAVSIPPKT